MAGLPIPLVKRFRMHAVAVEVRGAPPPGLLEDFDFYTDRPAILDSREDFAVVLELVHRTPSPSDLPTQAAARAFAEGTLYREGSRLFYEYAGAVLSIDSQPRASFARLITRDPAAAARIGRRFLQSEIGRGLDRAGLHRVNGLGLGLPGGRGALLLLPAGVDRAALAVPLLAAGAVLLSEEAPLVDRFGHLLPYPLPLRFPSAAVAPASWRERLEARGGEFVLPATKLPSAYLPRVSDRFRPSFMVLASRKGGNASATWETLPRWKSGRRLLRDLVAGFGLAGVEEGLPDLASLVDLAPTGPSRLAATTALLARAQHFQLTLSLSHEENARALSKAFALGKND